MFGRAAGPTWLVQGQVATFALIWLPGNLPIKPYTGTTVYTMDDSSGLIVRHDETWDISALDAFVSTLVPGLNFGAAPAPPVK